MPEYIAIINQKGGVGKTTTCANLASSLARYQKRVLIVDIDPQGNCSTYLGVDASSSKRTISELLLGTAEIKRCIKKTNLTRVSIIPSNLNLAVVESTLIKTASNSKTLLREKIRTKDLLSFDYVIIDCPPSLGFLSLNAFNAADDLIIPVQCESFAVEALAQIFSTIYTVQKESNRDLSILGILLTMYDQKTKFSSEISREIRTRFSDYVFTTVIPRNVSILESIAYNTTVDRYKPNSLGSLAYQALAREVIERVQLKQSD